MQPKSQLSSGYSAHKALALGAQLLSLMSPTTLIRPCSLRVSSAQAIQPTSPQRPESTSSEELNHLTQAMQPKSQFSSGSSAHKASASRSLEAQSKYSIVQRKPCRPRTVQLIRLTQAMQLKKLIRFMQSCAKYTSRDSSGKK